MSLVKLSPSAWRYFAEEIATGREDYYAAAAERPGRFLGRGAHTIGLTTEDVVAEGLERLIGHGCDPRDGRPFGRAFPPESDRIVAGFGLTFSPPKTVSVLWGTSGEELGAEVLGAHERSVEVALEFLQEHAAFTRTRSGGIFQVDTDGFVAAAFTHRTSRAADPQLHTHVLVANKVRAADGRWRSIDARELFEYQKAAGMLYKAAFRAELSSSLGVEWTPVDENGISEIEGVPELLVETWSSRRRAVESLGAQLVAAREVELGRVLSSGERAAAFQLAAYRTRAPKIEATTPTAELTARWRAEAAEWGHPPEQWLSDVVGRDLRPGSENQEEMVSLAIGRLQDATATWGRSDVVEVLSTLVSGSNGEAVRSRVEELADRVLGDRRVCSLAAPLAAEPPAALRRQDGMSAIERHGAVRYTTQVTLQREVNVLDAVAKGVLANAGIVADDIVANVLAASVLGADQRRAIRQLLRRGERVALLVGPAGAGKSRALDAAREAWELAGFRPIGLAPSAMAASVLSEEAGLQSETLARLLLDVENKTRQLDGGSVVILDEAAMARTDDLERLVTRATQYGAKVVLVGDPDQLGSVGPGGLFRTLVGDHGAAELETVRRFDHVWERAASLRLRARDTSVLEEYFERGRISGGSEESMRQDAFRAWRLARDEGKSVLVLAGDNKSVDAFALRCREDRVARGEVERDGTRLANGIAGVGDEIVTLRNDRRLQPAPGEFVRNGERWRVVDRDDKGSLLVTSLDGSQRVELPAAYVREHVALGYALTIHKAQGATTDRSIVLVDEQMTAQQLYVAMSRGGEENHAFVVRSHVDLDEHRWERRGSPTTVEVLTDVMRRDGADRSAHDVMRDNVARMEDLDLLRHLLSEARHQVEAGAGPDRRREMRALEPLADVARAEGAAWSAGEAIRRAAQRRADAETALARAEIRPARAPLPGRLGSDARRESEVERQLALREFESARITEHVALRAFAQVQHDLEEAKRAATQLTRLREAHKWGTEWLRAHPDEVRWVVQLADRVRTRQDEIERMERNVAESVGATHATPSSRRHLVEAEVEATGSLTDPATQAVLARARSTPDRGYVQAPELPAHGSERGGPVLGR